MATTIEKMHMLVHHLATMPRDELAPEAVDMGELLQIVRGFGFDPIAMIMPKSEAEADVVIDKLIALALYLRGDDLPPFDPDRYGEAELAGAEPADA
jgi:hypothetical protein